MTSPKLTSDSISSGIEILTLLDTVSRRKDLQIQISVNKSSDDVLDWEPLKRWVYSHSGQEYQDECKVVELNSHGKITIDNVYILIDGTFCIYTRCQRYIRIRVCEIEYTPLSVLTFL